MGKFKQKIFCQLLLVSVRLSLFSSPANLVSFFGYKCYYYTQIKGNYLFHSIIYNLDDTVRDGRLGMRLSDGCIRLAKENAKWIWDNVGFGSAIHIE